MLVLDILAMDMVSTGSDMVVTTMESVRLKPPQKLLLRLKLTQLFSMVVMAMLVLDIMAMLALATMVMLDLDILAMDMVSMDLDTLITMASVRLRLLLRLRLTLLSFMEPMDTLMLVLDIMDMLVVDITGMLVLVITDTPVLDILDMVPTVANVQHKSSETQSCSVNIPPSHQNSFSAHLQETEEKAGSWENQVTLISENKTHITANNM